MRSLDPTDPAAVGGYSLLAQLGAGGMGQVFLARTVSGRPLALKTTTVADRDTALRQLAAVLPAATPSIVVLDELPWMLDGDPVPKGTLQTVWDRVLSRKPVLLILM